MIRYCIIVSWFQGAFRVDGCPIWLACQDLWTFVYSSETHSSNYFFTDSILQYNFNAHIPEVPDTMTRYMHERLVTLSQRIHSDAARDAAREVDRESQNVHDHLGAGHLSNSRAEHQEIGGE